MDFDDVQEGGDPKRRNIFNLPSLPKMCVDIGGFLYDRHIDAPPINASGRPEQVLHLACDTYKNGVMYPVKGYESEPDEHTPKKGGKSLFQGVGFVTTPYNGFTMAVHIFYCSEFNLWDSTERILTFNLG